jgi:hypothetical protein
MIEHGVIVPPRLMSECTCEPSFAEAGFPDDDQVLLLRDPVHPVAVVPIISLADMSRPHSAKDHIRLSESQQSCKASISKTYTELKQLWFDQMVTGAGASTMPFQPG